MTDFATATERLINQVKHWEQPRWSAPAGLGNSKADETYALVQRLADLCAEAEGRPRRPVPREHDLILPDQLQVMADDLLAAAPAAPGPAAPGPAAPGPAAPGPAAPGPAAPRPDLLEVARSAVEDLRGKL